MDLPEEVVDDLRKRLRRIGGQIEGIERMLDDGRECRDLVTQISAHRCGEGASVGRQRLPRAGPPLHVGAAAPEPRTLGGGITRASGVALATIGRGDIAQHLLDVATTSGVGRALAC